MGVLINEHRQQKNEIITAVNRNVPNFSLETEKAEINDTRKLMLTNTKILATLNTLNFFMICESESKNLNCNHIRMVCFID